MDAMGFEWFWFYLFVDPVWFAHSKFLLVSSCHNYIHLNFQMLPLFVRNLSSRWGARCSRWTTEVADVFPYTSTPKCSSPNMIPSKIMRSIQSYVLSCISPLQKFLPSKLTCLLTIIQDKYIYTELLLSTSPSTVCWVGRITLPKANLARWKMEAYFQVKSWKTAVAQLETPKKTATVAIPLPKKNRTLPAPSCRAAKNSSKKEGFVDFFHPSGNWNHVRHPNWKVEVLSFINIYHIYIYIYIHLWTPNPWEMNLKMIWEINPHKFPWGMSVFGSQIHHRLGWVELKPPTPRTAWHALKRRCPTRWGWLRDIFFGKTYQGIVICLVFCCQLGDYMVPIPPVKGTRSFLQWFRVWTSIILDIFLFQIRLDDWFWICILDTHSRTLWCVCVFACYTQAFYTLTHTDISTIKLQPFPMAREAPETSINFSLNFTLSSSFVLLKA